MSLVVAAVVGGGAAAIVAFVTMRAQNRKAHAEAYKAETEADSLIISNLRGEVERLTGQLSEVRSEIESVNAALDRCHTENEALVARVEELERVVANHHSPTKRGNGRTT